MLKKMLSAVSVCLILGASTASAAPFVDAGPGPGYFASDNVEFVGHVPLNNDSAGGKIVGDYFYITSSRGLLIYDISDPIAPKQVGILPLLQQPYFAEEDPDTNGKILLVGGLDGVLNVISVEDKTNPQTSGPLTARMPTPRHAYSIASGPTTTAERSSTCVIQRLPRSPAIGKRVRLSEGATT